MNMQTIITLLRHYYSCYVNDEVEKKNVYFFLKF